MSQRPRAILAAVREALRFGGRRGPDGLLRAFRWVGDGGTVTAPARVHAYQRLCLALIEHGVLPGGVLYRVEHRAQRAAIPPPTGEPRLIVCHEPDCPIAYD